MQKKGKISAWKLITTTFMVFILLRYFLPLFFPFIASFFLVRTIRRIGELAERKLCIKKQVAMILCCVLFLSAMIFFAYWLVLCISRQGIQMVRYVESHYESWQKSMCGLCGRCDLFFGLQAGTVEQVMRNGLAAVYGQAEAFLSEWIPGHLWKAVSACIGVLVTFTVVGMASVLLFREYEEIRSDIMKQRWYEKFLRFRECLSGAGSTYLKTQGTIFLCVLLYSSLGLWLLGYENAFFLGVFIGTMDFLPVFGAGTILIPWGILLLLQREWSMAAGILAIYLLCFVTRQYLEPHMMGKRNGIRPFYMLISIYLGLRLFGFWGVFLGPMGLVLIRGLVISS